MENSRTPGPIDEQFKARMDQVIRNSQKYMLHIQRNEGFWWGELESNPTMESEYLMLTYFTGTGFPGYGSGRRINNASKRDDIH